MCLLGISCTYLAPHELESDFIIIVIIIIIIVIVTIIIVVIVIVIIMFQCWHRQHA